MRKIFLFLSLGLFLFCPSLFGQNKIVIKVTEASLIADGQTIQLSGEANLRSQSLISISLRYAGEVGLWKKIPLKSGRFDVRIQLPKKRIIPGEYTLRAEFFPRLQSRRIYPSMLQNLSVEAGEKKIYLGDKAREKEEVESVKNSLLETMDSLRRVYLNLEQRGGYLLAHVKFSRLKNRGSVDERLRGKVDRGWKKFYREFWRVAYRTIRYNFYRYQDLRFLSPFPEAEKDIANIIEHIYKLYVSYTIQIYGRIERPKPKDLKYNKVFDTWTLKRQIEKLVGSAYKSLGDKGEEWPLVSMSRKEEGDLSKDENTYSSRVTKFKVTKPKAWFFDFQIVSPSVRLRIRPGTKELRALCTVAIEIFDYPEAESFDDLTKLTQIRARNRYLGFKKIKSRSLKEPDDEMRDGVRPGYELILETKDKSGAFVVLQYELYCRWHKRTYGVVCITRKENYQEFSKTFAQICRSFRVLDAPEQAKKAKEEEKKKREKEKGK